MDTWEESVEKGCGIEEGMDTMVNTSLDLLI